MLYDAMHEYCTSLYSYMHPCLPCKELHILLAVSFVDPERLKVQALFEEISLQHGSRGQCF